MRFCIIFLFIPLFGNNYNTYNNFYDNNNAYDSEEDPYLWDDVEHQKAIRRGNILKAKDVNLVFKSNQQHFKEIIDKLDIIKDEKITTMSRIKKSIGDFFYKELNLILLTIVYIRAKIVMIRMHILEYILQMSYFMLEKNEYDNYKRLGVILFLAVFFNYYLGFIDINNNDLHNTKY